MASKEQELIIKIKAQADQAQKDIKKLTGQIQTLSKENTKVSNSSGGIDKVSKSYSGLTKVIGGVVAGFGALGVAVTAFDLAKLAGDAERVGGVFDTLFTDLGLNAEQEFEKIREASKGLVDEASLKQSAVTAVSLGVPIEKLSELMEVARVKAMVMGTDVKSAFNDLAVGIGRGSPMILDNLGLTIKLEEANEAYATKLGKTTDELTKQEKQIALTNAVLDASKGDMERFGDAGLTASEQTQAFNAQLEELKVNVGKALIGPMQDLTKRTTEWLKTLNESDFRQFKKRIDGVIEKLEKVWRLMGYLNDIAVPDWFQSEDKTLTGQTGDVIDDIVDSIDSWYEALDSIFNAQDDLFDAQTGYQNLANQVKSFTGTSEDFEMLERSMKKAIEETSALHEKWSNAKNPEAYKEVIKDLDETMKGLGDAYSELMTKKPFEPSIESADLLKEKTRELSDAVKDMDDEKLEALKENNKEQIADTKKKISELERLEKKYLSEIQKAYDNYYKALDDIASDRFASELSISDKVRSALQETMTTVEQFKDRQLQAEEKLALAVDALNRNQLSKYETYIKQYEQLKSGQIDKEIKGGELVEKSAQETQSSIVSMYADISKLQNQYFQQREENARKEMEATVALKNAQIDASIAILEAKKEELKLAEALANMTADKKVVDLDLSKLDTAIHKLEGAKTLSNFLTEQPIKLNVDGTSLDPAVQKIQQIKTLTLNGITLEIGADTTPLDFGIQKTKTVIENDEIKITFNPKYEEAQKIIKDRLINPQEKDPIEKKIEVNTKDSEKDIEKDLKPIEEEPISKELQLELDQAIKDVDGFKDQVAEPSLHPIEVDNSAPERAIADNKKPTSSVHTIYIREVYTRSGGGSIPQRLAIGGTFTGSGRVAGYDPTDSDKVNAYLTGGEFVVKRSAVDKYGVAFLNAINSMRLPKINGYADGGLVNSGSSSNAQLRPVQLNIGQNSFNLMSPEETIENIIRYVNSQGGL